MLNQGDKIGIVACSNSKKEKDRKKIESLVTFLKDNYQLTAILSPAIFAESKNISPDKRATALMNMYKNSEVKAIFDISGGDLANQLLPLLDYKIIQQRNIPFVGYSDLTVILNAIYVKSNVNGVLFQLLNIIEDSSQTAKGHFERLFLEKENELWKLQGSWLTKNQFTEDMIMVGGNIRCFLKLAGTTFFPELVGKILLVESAGGSIERVISYFSQLEQLNGFKQIKGIIVGNFLELKERKQFHLLEEYLLAIATNNEVPIFLTSEIGHQVTSTAVPLGKYVKFTIN